MSLNRSINLKFQLGSELRKVSKAPRSLSELHSLLSVLYNREGFLISYQDEEGDLISITSEQDLQCMYEKNQGRPSVKLLLKETEEAKSEDNVLDRIQNLKQSLMSSVAGQGKAQTEDLEEQRQDSFNSIEHLNEYPEIVSECTGGDEEGKAEPETIEVLALEGCVERGEEGRKLPCTRLSESPEVLERSQPREVKAKKEKKDKKEKKTETKEKKEKKGEKKEKEKGEPEIIEALASEERKERVEEGSKMPCTRLSDCPEVLESAQPREVNAMKEKKEKKEKTIETKEKKEKKGEKKENENEKEKEKGEKKPKGKKEMKLKEEKKEKGSEDPEVVVHEYITCDGCQMSPLCGIRYKCTMCHDFDLCANCEETLNHPHPFIKIRQPMRTGAQAIWGNSRPSFSESGPCFGRIKEMIAVHIKEMIRKKYKVKVVQTLHSKNINVFPGTEVNFEWELMNKGRIAWPEGSKLVMTKGDFAAKEVVLPAVEPGQKVCVRVSAVAPDVEKSCSGVWKVVVGEKEFGKIKGLAVTIADQRVKELVGMGFTVENSKKALETNNGNFDLAISQLLKD